MKSEFTFKTAYRAEADQWSTNGRKITDPTSLALIRKALSEGRMFVLEHHHYRGSRCPDWIVIDEYDAFEDYLKDNAVAGDSVHLFDITACLQDGKQFTNGKCPDENDEVPEGGAY